MSTAQKIFSSILGLELIFTSIAYFIADTCGSACGKPGFLNPLGATKPGTICTLQCVQYQPGSLFYILADIFLLTVVVMAVAMVIMNRKK